ncbi:MAG: hypothetical protein Tsb002_36530 [Wenzhouxiangellaceae bacterium]
MHHQWLNRLLTLMIIGCAFYGNAYAAPDCNFDCMLQRHIQAIHDRDFDAFKSTISDDPIIDFILPNGRAFEQRDDYLNMIQGWFNESGWHFKPAIIRTITSPEMGVALLKVDYSEDDRGGEPYHLQHYLTLIFKLQNNEWRLVLDQNTKIETPAQSE